MRVDYVHFCENSVIEADTGKVSIINIFSVITSDEMPMQYRMLGAIFSVQYDPEDMGVERSVLFRVIDPEGRQLWGMEAGITRNERERIKGHAIRVPDLSGVVFQEYGIHMAQVLVDGVKQKETAINIRRPDGQE